ncbi:MAG: CaiB/BaiF CoA-transferase family protein [Pseudomonadota bacterium]
MNRVARTGLLNDLKVLDLSRILAGPFAAQMLGDFGAQVTKVEHPRGDDTRRWGPPFVADTERNAHNAAYFYCANRSKRIIRADFKTPEGLQIVKALAADADVLIENYKVDSLTRYGLDYASVKKDNPALVYCSITGFGQTGPYRHQPGFDFIIQGLSGLMSVTGAPDCDGGEPMRAGVAVSDLFAGLHASTAILAALRSRDTTGRGCHIDISLLDVQVAMLANQAANYLNGGDVPGRIGNTHPNIAPYQVFSTASEPIIIAVGNDAQFSQLCNVLEQPSWADDSRFDHNASRVIHRDELAARMTDVLVTKSAKVWLDLLTLKGVPAGPINTLDEVFRDPQVVARQLCQDTVIDNTRVRTVANPVVINTP